MNILEFLQTISAGSVVSVIVLFLTLVEITPIKISPLQWVGKRINAETLNRLDKVEEKLDEHIAQSYRNKILSFQNECLKDIKHTKEEFDEVLEACELYEEYVKANELKNDKCGLAIKYIKQTYMRCLNSRSFAVLN